MVSREVSACFETFKSDNEYSTFLTSSDMEGSPSVFLCKVLFVAEEGRSLFLFLTLDIHARVLLFILNLDGDVAGEGTGEGGASSERPLVA